MELLLNDEVGQQKLLEKLADEVTAYMLPEVDDEDAGKTVVVSEEGKWEVGEAGGGGEAYKFYLTLVETSGGTSYFANSEMTGLDDIIAAWNAGQRVICVLQETYGPETFTVAEVLISAVGENSMGNPRVTYVMTGGTDATYDGVYMGTIDYSISQGVTCIHAPFAAS